MARTMSRTGKVLTALACFAAAIALIAGCGDSGGGATTSTTGTLKVSLTDKASDDYDKVVVAIKEVRVVPAGLEDAADDDSRLPVVATYVAPHVVDILTLRFQQELLGTINIPAGAYNQVRLILERNPQGNGQEPVNYLTLKTAPTVKVPLTTPSAQESGLKVVGQFQVKAGKINAILIDFDPNTAIVVRGNGDYNLKPTGIRIVQPSTALASFGSISGTVTSAIRDWVTATVSITPPDSSIPVAAGAIFSNMTSVGSPVPFSAFVPGGTYRVHVQAAGFAPYSSPVHTVTNGADTPNEDIVLQPLAQ